MMAETTDHVLLLRLGEVFLKGENRPFFLKKLRRSIERALADLEGWRIEAFHDRFRVWCPQRIEALAAERLGRVFGLVSLSPAVRTEPTVEAIRQEVLAAARRLSDRPAPTFRIAVHRRDKRFPIKSPELAAQLGADVIQLTGWKVDLRHPDVTIEVEVERSHAFVYSERIPGAGGLPSGVSGRVLLLLSGGIDSPVAGWLLGKRGVALSAVTFQSPPYTAPEAEEKVIDLTQALARWVGPIPLYVVHFTEIQKELRRAGPGELGVVLYRRMMLRIASQLARRERAEALATGDSLGQVASQTLENLTTITEAASLPVLRPLLAFDKVETISLARKIGTYDISIRPFDDCCNLFVPPHPETRARLEACMEAEARLGEPPEETAERLAQEARRLVITAGNVD